MRRGQQKGSKFCDLLETLKFLDRFKKTPKNAYQLYHSSLHFDTKKIYRYLRYCIKAELLEIDHIEEDKFLPTKYYKLTSTLGEANLRNHKQTQTILRKTATKH